MTFIAIKDFRALSISTLQYIDPTLYAISFLIDLFNLIFTPSIPRDNIPIGNHMYLKLVVG